MLAAFLFFLSLFFLVNMFKVKEMCLYDLMKMEIFGRIHTLYQLHVPSSLVIFAFLSLHLLFIFFFISMKIRGKNAAFICSKCSAHN